MGWVVLIAVLIWTGALIISFLRFRKALDRSLSRLLLSEEQKKNCVYDEADLSRHEIYEAVRSEKTSEGFYLVKLRRLSCDEIIGIYKMRDLPPPFFTIDDNGGYQSFSRF